MNPKSYVRFYAFREMKSRPRTFLPLLAIFFGVILLSANLLIGQQCRLTTNTAYYRVKTQLILPNIRENEITLLKELPYVKQLETVAVGTEYTCYIELTEDVVNRYDKIRNCLYNTIEQLDLQERSEGYIWFWETVHDTEKWEEAYRGTSMLNAYYMLFLQKSLFQPYNIYLVLMAMVMLFAVTVLVYRMKLAQGTREYACLTGMGLTSRQLEGIQMIQGGIILNITFFPAVLLAIITMWTVCCLSKNIYPQFDGNQALLFDIPWFTLGMLYILYQVAVYLGILIAMIPLRKQSVSALLRGYQDKIPFVSRSSSHFLSRGTFDGYRKLWKKRNRRNLIPVTILFMGLILLPAYLFGSFISISKNGWKGETEGVQRICSIEATNVSGGVVYGIPYTMLSEMMTIPEVTGITFRPMGHLSAPKNLQYIYYDIHTADGVSVAKPWMTVPLPGDDTDSVYATLAEDEILVGEDFPGTVGDTVRLTWGEGSAMVRIRAKVPELNGYMYKSPYFEEEGYGERHEQAAISPALYCSLTGDTDAYLESDTNIWADVTPETVESVLNRIAICLGDKRMYLNDYDRQLHSGVERGFKVVNEYYEIRVRQITNTYGCLFLLTQSLYLFCCAVVVIGTTVDFQLRRRKEEFSVLRALGLPETELFTVCASYAGNLFLWGIPLLYPVLVLLFWFSEPGAGLQLDMFGNPYWGNLETLMKALWIFALTSGLMGIAYGGVSRNISRKMVRDVVSVPLAVLVKERE